MNGSGENRLVLNHYVCEIRNGDIYNYAFIGLDDGGEILIDINDEYVGYVFDRDYAKQILDRIEKGEDNEIIRIVVKREASYEKKRLEVA